MFVRQPAGDESRSPIRVALYAAGASLILISGLVIVGSFRAQEISEASKRRGPPPSIDASAAFAMHDAPDGTDFDRDPGYADSFRTVRHAKQWPVEDLPWLDRKAAMADPKAYRARPVKARGLVIDLRAFRLPAPVEGEADVFRGFVMDTDGKSAVAFDLVAPPGLEVEIGKDVLDVAGVFYRTVAFDAWKEKEPGKERVPEEEREKVRREIPYLLAHSIRPVPPAAPWHGLSPTVTAVLGLGAGVGIVLLARARARSKEPPRTTAAMREMLRQRAAAAQAEAQERAKERT